MYLGSSAVGGVEEIHGRIRVSCRLAPKPTTLDGTAHRVATATAEVLHLEHEVVAVAVETRVCVELVVAAAAFDGRNVCSLGVGRVDFAVLDTPHRLPVGGVVEGEVLGEFVGSPGNAFGTGVG